MPNDCLLYSHVPIPTVTGLSGVPRVGIFKIGQLRAELRVDEADTVFGDFRLPPSRRIEICVSQIDGQIDATTVVPFGMEELLLYLVE